MPECDSSSQYRLKKGKYFRLLLLWILLLCPGLVPVDAHLNSLKRVTCQNKRHRGPSNRRIEQIWLRSTLNSFDIHNNTTAAWNVNEFFIERNFPSSFTKKERWLKLERVNSFLSVFLEYHQNFIGSIGLFRIANISKIMRQTFLLTDEIVR